MTTSASRRGTPEEGMTGPAIVFDHIAIAAARIADATGVLVGELGGVPDAGGPSDVFSWGCWRYTGGGKLEVIEPRGADGFLHRFLATRGPGIHHVTFRVPSLAETCDRAAAQGYEVVGRDESDPHWKVAYLHPRQALGIVVQIAQPGARSAGRQWQPPPGPPSPPLPVTILGLRMRAHCGERARAQWAAILRGEVEDGVAGELSFRWPGSPMRITVEIDPAGEEGPLSIEVTAEQRPSLPAGPVPKLGTVFAQQA